MAAGSVTASVVASHGLLGGIRGQTVSGYEIHMGHTRADTFELYFRIALLATGRITEKAALLQNYKNRPVQVIENLCLLGPDEFLVPLWELARTHFSAR